VVDAVQADTFVELQMTLCAPLAHDDIVVEAFVLVEDNAGGIVPAAAERTARLRGQRHKQHKQEPGQWNPAVARVETAEADHTQQAQGQNVEGPTRAKGRDEPKHR